MDSRLLLKQVAGSKVLVVGGGESQQNDCAEEVFCTDSICLASKTITYLPSAAHHRAILGWDVR